MKLLSLVVVLLAAANAVNAATSFPFRELNKNSTELLENGEPVFVYNHGMILANGAPEDKRRSSYLHPVYAPDGTVITDDFPKDHWHHRGVFWAWPIVRSGGKQYDPWAVQGLKQQFVRWIARTVNPDSARLAVENGWFVNGRKIVRETIEIVARPTAGNERVLEFRLTFEATEEPVEIEGEPQDRKGYGGFSARFAPRENTVITTDKGLETVDTNMVPHPWAQIAGIFEGRRASLRIDDYAANPGTPNGWCLRNYGFLGVNFPGLKPYTLQPGRPLALRYKVTIRSEN